jgi:hypothetical protein
MNESDWLTSSDPVQMLVGIEKRSVRARRLRLFAAACCRRAWADLTDPRCRDAVEVLERFADGPGKKDDQAELKAAHEAASEAAEQADPLSRSFHAAEAVATAVEPTLAWWATRWAADGWLRVAEMPAALAGPARRGTNRPEEEAHLARLLRDVLGNPFRPLAVDPGVRTPTVAALAQAAYDERVLPGGELDAARLAVLADAIEEAGGPADLLAHLRGPGPHVRGCFVVDALLNRK